MILAILNKRGKCEVKNFEMEFWTCTIDEVKLNFFLHFKLNSNQNNIYNNILF
jgi:hypothetical protein